MNKQQAVKAMSNILDVIRDGVRDMGQMPRGLLYMALMEHGATLTQYNAIEQLLVADGRVQRHGDLLVWKGDAA